ncbi:MAG: protein kinase [Myxococcales bacterium]|nr:protein kinase [Myxococcales bacterium]
MARRPQTAQARAHVAKAWQALAVAVLCALISGCARGDAVELPAWTLEVPGAAPEPITLPAHFFDKLGPHAATYVLRSRLAVPERMRGHALTLTAAHMTARAELYVDGERAVAIDDAPFDRYRQTGPHRWRIAESTSRRPELELEIRAEHRMWANGWIDGVPELSASPSGRSDVSDVHTFNSVAAVGALTTAFVVTLLYGFLFVSLRDERRKAYGFFAVGAACGMSYPAFVLGLTQPVFGNYEAAFMTVALVLGSVAAMFFTRAYCGAPPPSRAWWAVVALSAVGAVIVRDPFRAVLFMGPVVIVVTLAHLVSQQIFLARTWRSKSRPRNIATIALAWPATVLLGAPDIAAWLGQGERTGGLRTACIGITAISLWQAMALSREHLTALKRADDLNRELTHRLDALETKNREVEHLNDELRRQIAARSRELAEKLAQMEDTEAAPPPVLEPGMLVDGRYRVVRQIGSGGMGAVYQVERLSDGKEFALKALSGGGSSQARARFAREAQICATVNHPNVVAIVDVDVAKSGFIFLVMELVRDGATLHDVRRRHRDNAWTLGVLAQVADGIDAIHARGIVHRDLKPGNILLSRGADGRRPVVKITDFGISSLQADGSLGAVSARAQMVSVPDPFEGVPAVAGDDVALVSPTGSLLLDLEYDPEAVAETAFDSERVDSGDKLTVEEGAARRGREANKPPTSAPLTETGMIFGTPQYMAQELSTGTKNATPASDVFALGIIAFELLTGRRPFIEGPVSSRLHGRPLQDAPSFHVACPTLPRPIATLLDRAMSHDPAARPTAKEIAQALREGAEQLAAAQG